MEQVLHTFGVDWRLLLINAANFGLLLFVLWYFLYGPVVRMLEERRTKVAEGVKNAERAAAELAKIERERAEMLAKAGREADDVVAKARAAGALMQKNIVGSAEAAAARVLQEAEAQANELKEAAISESKHEVAKLIVLGVEKALQQAK